jgi:hypothetical protein
MSIVSPISWNGNFVDDAPVSFAPRSALSAARDFLLPRGYRLRAR